MHCPFAESSTVLEQNKTSNDGQTTEEGKTGIRDHRSQSIVQSIVKGKMTYADVVQQVNDIVQQISQSLRNHPN